MYPIVYIYGLNGLSEAIKIIFTTDDSLMKSLYLATEQIILKWISTAQN